MTMILLSADLAVGLLAVAYGLPSGLLPFLRVGLG